MLTVTAELPWRISSLAEAVLAATLHKYLAILATLTNLVASA